MTEAARVWAAAERPVVGIAPSQSARNTLADNTGQLQAVENGGAMSLLVGGLFTQHGGPSSSRKYFLYATVLDYDASHKYCLLKRLVGRREGDVG